MLAVSGASAMHWIWRSDAVLAQAVRLLLAPASWLFGVAVLWRNRRFDRAWSHPDAPAAPAMPLPALAIGNLTVGGTGKTPVSAWFARELRQRGAVPSIVLRGYGDDEWRVHELLNPAVHVVCNADRVSGAHLARMLGADVVVLDDAFQHRRARRVADVVLLSADQWGASDRLLPAGPYRERMNAVRRASCVIITIKSDRGRVAVDPLIARLAEFAPRVPYAVVRIVPDRLCSTATVSDGEAIGRTMAEARGARWGVVSGIGDPVAFEAQLAAEGLTIGGARRFADHHRYVPADVTGLLRDFSGMDGVICTLKDAVKLGPLWPPGALPLWYVSQTLVVERGAAVLVEQIDRVLSARSTTIPTSG